MTPEAFIIRDMADLELAPSEAQQEMRSRTGWGPYDTAYSLPVGPAGVYAVLCTSTLVTWWLD